MACQIIVEKLSKNVHEAHLREIFGQYGDLRSVTMPMNPKCTWRLSNHLY